MVGYIFSSVHEWKLKTGLQLHIAYDYYYIDTKMRKFSMLIFSALKLQPILSNEIRRRYVPKSKNTYVPTLRFFRVFQTARRFKLLGSLRSLSLNFSFTGLHFSGSLIQFVHLTLLMTIIISSNFEHMLWYFWPVFF